MFGFFKCFFFDGGGGGRDDDEMKTVALGWGGDGGGGSGDVGAGDPLRCGKLRFFGFVVVVVVVVDSVLLLIHYIFCLSVMIKIHLAMLFCCPSAVSHSFFTYHTNFTALVSFRLVSPPLLLI